MSDRRMTHSYRFWLPLIGAIAVRPQLWWTALRQLGRITPARWWARPPFIPWPDAGYVQFRLETAYGAHGVPQAADAVRYLEWCHEAERAR